LGDILGDILGDFFINESGHPGWKSTFLWRKKSEASFLTTRVFP
jgi:hypothetical protein